MDPKMGGHYLLKSQKPCVSTYNMSSWYADMKISVAPTPEVDGWLKPCKINTLNFHNLYNLAFLGVEFRIFLFKAQKYIQPCQ